jgi:DNA-binding IclR family transcriptional regulator
MAAALSAGHVKSAQRVLEVFEYFNGGRQTATVMEISRRCGYPQSSASKLLSCLAGLGYLHHDHSNRTYRPTARVALLGSWVQPHLFRRGALLRMIDELADEIDCEVWLGAQVGLEAQILQTVTPAGRKMRNVRSGSSRSLLRSPLGRVLLSAADAAHARKLVHRLNADAPAEKKLSWPELETELTLIRAQGHALTVHDWDSGEDSGCAVLLPRRENEDRLALLIRAGATPCDILVRHAQSAITRCLASVITQ